MYSLRHTTPQGGDAQGDKPAWRAVVNSPMARHPMGGRLFFKPQHFLMPLPLSLAFHRSLSQTWVQGEGVSLSPARTKGEQRFEELVVLHRVAHSYQPESRTIPAVDKHDELRVILGGLLWLGR